MRFPRAGISLIELLAVISILLVCAGIILPAIQGVRAASARRLCAANLRQIGLAIQQYHNNAKHLPPGVSYRDGDDPLPYVSWQTRLLPYLERDDLWKQTQQAFAKTPNFTESPPHPSKMALPVFNCPADGRGGVSSKSGNGFTSYLGVEGTDRFICDGVLFMDSQVRFDAITDGLGNTLMAGERPPSADETLGWWYAGWGQNRDGSAEMILGVRELAGGKWAGNCPIGPFSFGPGKFDNQCDAFHFWSPHPGGAHFLFADGSVRFLDYSAAPLMPALATRNGGEVVTLPE